MSFSFEAIQEHIFSDIILKMEFHAGLSIFSSNRAKFEGWLKVELIESLSKYYDDVLPENERIDVTIKNWGIELKTINTNYRFKKVKNLHRPITKNIKGILSDIEKLEKVSLDNKAILFVAFPLTTNLHRWQVQKEKISCRLQSLKEIPFNFKNGIPAVLYFGKL